MRNWIRRLALAGLLGAAGVGDAASAGATHRDDCRETAMAALQDSARDGYAIYRRLTDKAFFLNWVSCDDPQLGLATAVHESVHFVTADIDAYPLIDGRDLKRPHEATRFFPPSRIAGAFRRDDFVATYLKPGRATSSSDFLYLLDELNAYTHDLNAALDLTGLRRDDLSSDSRDGLAALMAFVALYVEKAERDEPETWAGLRKPAAAQTLAALWGSAETVMAASCGVPNLGAEDKTYIRMFCRAGPRAALATVIGREPACPTACLKAAEPELSVRLAGDEAPDVRARTIWRRRAPRRLSPAPEPVETGE